MSAASKSTPADLRRARRPRRSPCFGHLVVAPLWVAYRANLGTLLRTCDAVGACIAVPHTQHYRDALAQGDTLGARRPHVHWISGDKVAWVDQQRADGWRIVAVELADDATPLTMLRPGPCPDDRLVGPRARRRAGGPRRVSPRVRDDPDDRSRCEPQRLRRRQPRAVPPGRTELIGRVGNWMSVRGTLPRSDIQLGALGHRQGTLAICVNWRKEWDSNPRRPIRPQRCSRPSHSSTLASFRRAHYRATARAPTPFRPTRSVDAGREETGNVVSRPPRSVPITLP